MCRGGIAVYTESGKDILYLADFFGYRIIDGTTGKVKTTLAIMESPLARFPTCTAANEHHLLVSSAFGGWLAIVDRKTLAIVRTVSGLKAPHDTIELGDGSLIVAEQATGSLVHIAGKTQKVIAKDLGGPTGLAKAGNEDLYVSEVYAGRISKINIHTGNKTEIVSGLQAPEGISVGPDGNIVVAEVGKQRLISVNPSTKKNRGDNKELENWIKGVAIGAGRYGGTRKLYPHGSSCFVIWSNLRHLRYFKRDLQDHKGIAEGLVAGEKVAANADGENSRLDYVK